MKMTSTDSLQELASKLKQSSCEETPIQSSASQALSGSGSRTAMLSVEELRGTFRHESLSQDEVQFLLDVLRYRENWRDEMVGIGPPNKRWDRLVYILHSFNETLKTRDHYGS